MLQGRAQVNNTWFSLSNRAVSYPNKTHRLILKAVYGKFMKQIMTVRGYSNSFVK